MLHCGMFEKLRRWTRTSPDLLTRPDRQPGTEASDRALIDAILARDTRSAHRLIPATERPRRIQRVIDENPHWHRVYLAEYTAPERRISGDCLDLLYTRCGVTNFSHCTFDRISLADGQYENIDFSYATFSNCDFTDALFQNCCWKGATIDTAILNGTEHDLSPEHTLSAEHPFSGTVCPLILGSCKAAEYTLGEVLHEVHSPDARSSAYRNGVLITDGPVVIGLIKNEGNETFFPLRTIKDQSGEILTFRGGLYSIDYVALVSIIRSYRLERGRAGGGHDRPWSAIDVKEIAAHLGARAYGLHFMRFANSEAQSLLDDFAAQLESRTDAFRPITLQRDIIADVRERAKARGLGEEER